MTGTAAARASWALSGAFVLFAISCVPHRPVGAGATQASLPELARLLDDPRLRDDAACSIFGAGQWLRPARYKEPHCGGSQRTVNHVVQAKQPDGSLMRVVFRRVDWLTREEAAPGQARGPFSLVNDRGQMVPVFENANMLDDWGGIIGFAGDDRKAIVHVIQYGQGPDAPRWTAQTLNVVPVMPEQRSVLSVVLGPPLGPSDDVCKGFSWSWRSRDADGDGLSEIEIGPFTSPTDIAPRAVYRWSEGSGRYEGPAGSVEAGFMRLDSPSPDKDCCRFFEAVQGFTRARLALGAESEPTVFRKSHCIGSDVTAVVE